jgi:hypothetical protein
MGGVVRPRLVELADASNKPLRVRTGKIGQHTITAKSSSG